METLLDDVWIVLAGGAASVAAIWVLAYLCADREGEMFISSDERVALARTEAMQEELASDGFPPLRRREIWRRVNWVWKSARVIALNSGHLPAIAALAFVGLLALSVAFVTFLRPRSADLGILLGGKEFIFYLVSSRRSLPRSRQRAERFRK